MKKTRRKNRARRDRQIKGRANKDERKGTG